MITQNIEHIRARIAGACSRATRDPHAVTLVAVTKGRAIEQVRQAIAAGITDIGENKVQEALVKHRQLNASSAIRWHMIGHLQTNKVKDAVRLFDVIHSVDSLHLAAEIDTQAARIGKVQDILIEVNTSGEASKFGVPPAEAEVLVQHVSALSNLSIKGLMTIAPAVDDPEQARPYFKQLRQLLDDINALRCVHYAVGELSMGMSDDFEVAVEEAATIVRLGRALFQGS